MKIILNYGSEMVEQKTQLIFTFSACTSKRYGPTFRPLLQAHKQ